MRLPACLGHHCKFRRWRMRHDDSAEHSDRCTSAPRRFYFSDMALISSFECRGALRLRLVF